ncbi:MAG: cell division protein FtsZ, partial [Acetobacteraceae bacterium]|nr:cell division protein FtsZ [Acetobacteraceae bacterium]
MIELEPLGADELHPRIIVIGVGGAGGNAVANMVAGDIMGVEFVVANTDAQALTTAYPAHPIQ